MKQMKIKNRVCLVVIDGWGLSDEQNGNAIKNAKTPVMDGLCLYNWQQIEAHGLHVGLPKGLFLFLLNIFSDCNKLSFV